MKGAFNSDAFFMKLHPKVFQSIKATIEPEVEDIMK